MWQKGWSFFSSNTLFQVEISFFRIKGIFIVAYKVTYFILSMCPFLISMKGEKVLGAFGFAKSVVHREKNVDIDITDRVDSQPFLMLEYVLTNMLCEFILFLGCVHYIFVCPA